MTIPTAASVLNDPRIYSAEITANNLVTARCLRKWIAAGRFPVPDGNLNGRNFWFVSTYQRWQEEVMAGTYKQERRPKRSASRAA
jgi:hypothetical protein